ncbi:short transient receptor potential channel 4-like isoform X2 [Acanthaster planci]|uniref:Short transient receptor potential channel 4-like isoform X2 n=1 Tax=Acanthaster planci TaxID=133434 RepID=A0A8B7ZN95_ACAPL|nr:short transient receptor potential channel 4-like isoform X2 [Acanthaster planci]
MSHALKQPPSSMDAESYELEALEKRNAGDYGPKEALQENGESSTATVALDDSSFLCFLGVEYEDESARYDLVRATIGMGNAIRLNEMLGQWQEAGLLRDWRNEENLTLYTDAITDGYIDVVNILLKYDIPLGDALIRAIDVEFEEAVKAICCYVQIQEDILESVLNCHSDNDDFHPAITPVIQAAQRNNFATVKMLLDLGASITEPSMSQGGDVTLTQAISTLHIYRALSQPAYILATQTDIFGHAFQLSAKLKTLSRTWEDFGAEYEQMARGVEVFAGEMLGESASTKEILALFRYHDTDKYRDEEGKQHPLAKLFEAIDYKQKEFIAHPHSQKAIIVQFYRNLLDWNERGIFYQILLTLFVLFGYPIICFLYIFVPVRSVTSFVRLPYIMMLMKAGSGFTFLAFIVTVNATNQHEYPRTVEALYLLILIWVLGLAWSHLSVIRKHGPQKYLSDGINLYEVVIVGLCIAVFCLQLAGRNQTSEGVFEPDWTNKSNLGNETYADLLNQVAEVTDVLRGRLNDTSIEGINGAIEEVLSGCRPLISIAPPSLPPPLRATIELDQFEPAVVARALFGVAITVSVLRLLNLLLVSDTVGPLRISLGGMVDDIIKFCGIFLIIWFAFAIGLFQNFYSAGQTATRACIEQGRDSDSCHMIVGFSTFVGSVQDLYWSLYGLTEIDVLELPGKNSVAEGVGTFLYVCYLIVAVLVLLNALIGMLSNTYNLTEENADTEWKFHRAAVWASYLRPVATLPPPFNLIPSLKTVYRLFRCACQICSGCTRRRGDQKEIHAKSELQDYKRVLKLVSSRYIQANLSTESQNSEGVRPRDLQTLRNDILSFKYAVQDRLASVNQTIKASADKSSNIDRKLYDLDPVKERTQNLVSRSSLLTDTVDTLHLETDRVHKEQETHLLQREQHLSEMEETVDALQTEMEELKMARDESVKELQDIIKGLQQDKIGLTTTLQGLGKDKAEILQEISELKAEQSVRDKARDQQEVRLLDIIQELRQEGVVLTDTLKALSEDKVVLTQQADDLKKDNSAKEMMRVKLESELQDMVRGLQQDKTILTDELRGVCEDKTALMRQVNQLESDYLAKEEIRNQREAELEGIIRGLQQAKTILTGTLQGLNENKTELSQQVDELKKDHSAKEMTRDHKEAELQGIIGGLQHDNAALTETLRGLRDDKADLIRQIGELSEELQKSRRTPPPRPKPRPKQKATPERDSLSDWDNVPEAKPEQYPGKLDKRQEVKPGSKSNYRGDSQSGWEDGRVNDPPNSPLSRPRFQKSPVSESSQKAEEKPGPRPDSEQERALHAEAGEHPSEQRETTEGNVGFLQKVVRAVEQFME